jgi:hypothetical protein
VFIVPSRRAGEGPVNGGSAARLTINALRRIKYGTGQNLTSSPRPADTGYGFYGTKTCVRYLIYTHSKLPTSISRVNKRLFIFGSQGFGCREPWVVQVSSCTLVFRKSIAPASSRTQASRNMNITVLLPSFLAIHHLQGEMHVYFAG